MRTVILVAILDGEGHPDALLLDLEAAQQGSTTERELAYQVRQALLLDYGIGVLSYDVQQNVEGPSIVELPADVRVTDTVTLYVED